MVRAWWVSVALAVALAAASVLVPVDAGAESGQTVVSTPPSGLRGHALFDSWFDLAPYGYEDHEFFVSGLAAGTPGTPAAGTTAPFTTRIIVTRPSRPSDFNGTVLLEWVNVTAQFENAVDIAETHEMLLREGYAFVHVSAQAAGLCCTPLTPKVWDPVRYAALHHPGDDYANDIFTQVARAIRAPARADDPRPMGPLTVRRLLAAGQSQSAGRLYDYVTKAQANAAVIDGFLIHGGGSKQYEAAPAAPVLHLLSDREGTPSEPSHHTNYRLWEVAGTAHSDFWIGYHQVFGQGPRTLAGAPRQPEGAEEDLHTVAGNYGEQVHPLQGTCILAGATMPMRYAASSAVHHLDRWVRTGDAPDAGPRFAFTPDGELAKDEFGNTRGGIRLPPIDVPVATYVTESCNLGGITVPFSDAQLLALYGDHATYYEAMADRADTAVAEGWLLPDDALDLMARACAAQNRFGDLNPDPCPYTPPQ